MRRSKLNGTRKRSAGDELIFGMTEVRDALRVKHVSKLTLRTVDSPMLPAVYTPARVRKTRLRLGVSQSIFADLVGVSVVLVQSWERGVRLPSKLASRLLDEINRDRDRWRQMAQPHERATA